MKRDHVLYLLAVAGGAAIWIVIAQVSGRKEAWDSGLYFSVGIPAVCALAFVLALFQPTRIWRWGILPMAGQLVAMLLTAGGGNLLPLGVILMGVLSVPAILAAWVATLLTARAKP
jgi:hypothetical protein